MESCQKIAAEVEPPAAVVHCASSGRRGPDAYEQVYLEGAQNLHAAFPAATLLFTSSTSVYPQTNGETVTEASEADPDRATGKILRKTEEFVLQNDGIVARLAGLYGPGRSVLLQRFLNGTAIIETGTSRFLNQLHRDDATKALATLLFKTPETKGQIYNVVDGNPSTQRDTFEKLALHFGKSAPPEGLPDPNRKRGWTHKAISCQKLKTLGWTPTYTSFLEAVKSDPRLVSSVQKKIESQ